MWTRRSFFTLGLGIVASNTVCVPASLASLSDIEAKDKLISKDEESLIGDIYHKQLVYYDNLDHAGSIVVDASKYFLYQVRSSNRAIRYGVGIGREGFSWHGEANIMRKEQWPNWHPPQEMRKRQPYLPRMMRGGIKNPLGARSFYLYQDKIDTLYRIHGTLEPETIGSNVSSGCIRMLNEHIIDLYNRVPIGTRVIVL